MILKWALREIFRSWKLSLFFVLNITLGLTGYISIEAFKGSLQNYLKDNAKQILTADLAVSVRRQLTENEIANTKKIIGPDSEVSESYDFFAMLDSSAGSKLVLVKAIDSNYPLYGNLQLEFGDIIESKTDKAILKEPLIWAYPELKYALNLKRGDSVRLGNLNLKIADYIAKDTSQTFRAASLAPRIYINRALLKESGLIQFGSTMTQALLFKISNEGQIESLQKKLLESLTDPAIQVDTSKTASQDSVRQLGYLSDFLGLVALVAIFLSSMGIAYIYQLFLGQRLKEIAIFRSLGLTTEQALAVYILQASLLGLFSMIPSLAGAQFFIPILISLISKVTPIAIHPTITWISVVLGAFISVIMSLLICLPFILQIKKLKPAQLLREEKHQFVLGQVSSVFYIPSLFIFWGLSVYQSNSLKTGSLFFGSLVGVTLGLGLIGWIGFWGLEKITPRTDWRIKYALKSITRKKSTSIAIFITLGVGTLLMNLLPQLKTSLKQDLSVDKSSPIPSLFFFDIQDEQIDPLKQLLHEQNLEFKTVAPLIRARILKINNVDYERKKEFSQYRTREEEQESRTRNRGVNLSYREKLSDSEVIVEGQPMHSNYSSDQKMAELSVEYYFADRLGLKLGDQITFDIQGVEMRGQIVNFRQVKWTSFQPNFFILFQNGVLNDAPKTFIGILPPLEESFKQKVLSLVVQKFANVSMIDVTRLIESILQIADQMSWSLELMSALAFLTGYIVLYSIVRSQLRSRRWELNMLKILGSNSKSLQIYILSEFVILSFTASFFGVCLSFLVSGIMMKFVFDSPVVFSWGWSAISLLIVPALSAVVSLWASHQVIQEKPLVLLRES